MLKGLVFEAGSPCPEPGMPLEAGGKQVGVVTSVAFSPIRNAPVALGIVRTSHSCARFHGTRQAIGGRRLPGRDRKRAADGRLGHGQVIHKSWHACS